MFCSNFIIRRQPRGRGTLRRLRRRGKGPRSRRLARALRRERARPQRLREPLRRHAAQRGGWPARDRGPGEDQERGGQGAEGAPKMALTSG